MVNPLISSFIFHKRAHIQFKKLEQCGDWFFSLFLCDFTFNSYNILNMIFIFDVSLPGLFINILDISQFQTVQGLACIEDGQLGQVFTSLLPTACAVSSFVRLSCQLLKKKIDVLNLFFYFLLVLILTIISSPNFSQCFR